VDDLYIFPAAHDAGAALGAALLLATQHGEPLCGRIDHAYWGPAFSDDAIFRALRLTGLAIKEVADIGLRAAELLCRGATVGWFQGRMEVGPRALGHRSILADPSQQQQHEHINGNVKHREIWRPFAPSLLPTAMGALLKSPVESPFMLQAFHVLPEARDRIPAVTHVDNTTRPQTITEATSSHYHSLLRGMERRIGVGAVLNTSFNDAHEPIVCTPLDAIRTFFSTDLDALVMSRFLIVKPEVRYAN
jgi:carbamoyltransferase